MRTRRVLSTVLALASLLLIIASCNQAQAAARLSWTDMSTNEDGFRVQRKIGLCPSSTNYSPLTTVGANIQTVDDASVKEGASYAYQVDAYNTAGDSAWSNCADISFPYTAASSPGNVAVTPSGLLSWQDKTSAEGNETGFRIERKQDPCGGTLPFVLLTTTLPNTTTYSDTGTVVEGQKYCYRVAAVGTLNTSPFSASVERTIPFVVPVPPTGLGAVPVP